MNTADPLELLMAVVTTIGVISSIFATASAIWKQSVVFRAKLNGPLRILASAYVRHEGMRLLKQSIMLLVAYRSMVLEPPPPDLTQQALEIRWALIGVSFVMTLTTIHDLYIRRILTAAQDDLHHE